MISKIIGIDFKPAWLSNPDIALAAVALLEIWNWTPFSFIICLPGSRLSRRTRSRSAEILGASKWRIFWEVQLPLLRPVIFLALVLRFLEAMAEFPKTWALFQGGPRIGDGNTAGLHLHDDLANIPSRRARRCLHRHALDAVIVLIAIQLLRREKCSLDQMYELQAKEAES